MLCCTQIAAKSVLTVLGQHSRVSIFPAWAFENTDCFASACPEESVINLFVTAPAGESDYCKWAKTQVDRRKSCLFVVVVDLEFISFSFSFSFWFDFVRFFCDLAFFKYYSNQTNIFFSSYDKDMDCCWFARSVVEYRGVCAELLQLEHVPERHCGTSRQLATAQRYAGVVDCAHQCHRE